MDKTKERLLIYTQVRKQHPEYNDYQMAKTVEDIMSMMEQVEEVKEYGSYIYGSLGEY
jgi:hypothetical protein